MVSLTTDQPPYGVCAKTLLKYGDAFSEEEVACGKEGYSRGVSEAVINELVRWKEGKRRATVAVHIEKEAWTRRIPIVNNILAIRIRDGLKIASFHSSA